MAKQRLSKRLLERRVYELRAGGMSCKAAKARVKKLLKISYPRANTAKWMKKLPRCK